MSDRQICDYITLHPFWLAGLIDGEGSFGVSITESIGKAGKILYTVSTTFYLGLHGRERYVQEGIQQYFGGCGYITTAGVKSGNFFSYQVRANADLMNVLIPFLDQHPLCTVKRLDYADLRTVVHMISRGEHRTPQGLGTIRSIKSGMNRGRVI